MTNPAAVRAVPLMLTDRGQYSFGDCYSVAAVDAGDARLAAGANRFGEIALLLLNRIAFHSRNFSLYQ